MRHISIDQMLQAGLILAGYNQKQRNRKRTQLIEWFKSNYGSHPLVYCVVWERLAQYDVERNLKYFLMTLTWFKNYDTVAILAGRFNLLDKKLIPLWCEYYMECLDELCQVPKSKSNYRKFGVRKYLLGFSMAPTAAVTNSSQHTRNHYRRLQRTETCFLLGAQSIC